jgi:hypothetical protein
MTIEFLSIVIFTFALALIGLGLVTWWIERAPRKILGLAMIGSGLLVAVAYAFLGSRFALTLFGRLIVTVDLPRLMVTAVVYTIGLLTGLGLAGGVFLWISGRLVKPTPLERQIALFLGIILLVTLLISLVAIRISR